MSIGEMRSVVSRAYDGPTWKDKVKHMPDEQIVAVYYSLQKSGRLDRNKKVEANGSKGVIEQFYDPTDFTKSNLNRPSQMTIYDLLKQ